MRGFPQKTKIKYIAPFGSIASRGAGCGKIFTDKATGTNTKRPALEKCLKALKAGDVLTVWKLDRLGRSLRDLIALLDDLKARGVAFSSR
jgi:DNA invertase Pin-like site-specific DNA recombinase